jgi:hypothetical protein
MPKCLATYQGYNSSQTGDFAATYNAQGNFLPGDCDVDFYDLDYLVTQWLDSDSSLNYPGATVPLNDSAHLMVRYEFDETSGSTAYDSSGNTGRDGTVGNPHPVMWDDDAISGTGCLNFEAGFWTWVDIPPAAYDATSNGLTFSFWSAYDMNFQPTEALRATWASVFTIHTKTPVEANANSALDDSQQIESQTPTPWPPNHEWGPQIRFVDMRNGSGTNVGRPGSPWVKFSHFGLQWNHYAYVFQKGATQGYKAIYENGERIGFVDGSDVNDPNDVNVPLPLWPTPGSMRLGTRSNRYYVANTTAQGPNWGFWYGKLDDFRIYNYALSEAEIQYLATKGTGTRTVSLMDPANLSTAGSPQRINFADYALFVNNWLDETLWP